MTPFVVLALFVLMTAVMMLTGCDVAQEDPDRETEQGSTIME